MTRLRRSLRGTAPEALTLEERYEKIISYVKDGQFDETLREFHMPSHVLTSFRNNSSPTANSRLETLPTDILLNIINMLRGNEQIMAALICKTLAAVVETCPLRKIANITYYKVSSKDPASNFDERTKNDKWCEHGFEPPAQNDFYYSYFQAAGEQHRALNLAVGKWIGPSYKFCAECRKFRPLEKQFWRDFAEYENPGIMKKVVQVAKVIKTGSKKKKKAKTAPTETDTSAMVEICLDKWQKPMKEKGWQADECPAHGLLQEKKGERVIKKFDYKVED